VAGAGELLGYGLRLASGYLSDRTGPALVTVAILLQAMAVPILWWLARKAPAARQPG
jgi:nitrate/nitrite transporter NarK